MPFAKQIFYRMPHCIALMEYHVTNQCWVTTMLCKYSAAAPSLCVWISRSGSVTLSWIILTKLYTLDIGVSGYLDIWQGGCNISSAAADEMMHCD